jgi:hypothetical protein
LFLDDRTVVEGKGQERDLGRRKPARVRRVVAAMRQAGHRPALVKHRHVVAARIPVGP